jgi:hypothetical protein
LGNPDEKDFSVGCSVDSQFMGARGQRHAIVSDGENNISLPNTETDIANKILKRFNYKTFGNKAYHLKRYQKYLNRGYIDSNNYIFNEINKWYS